MKAFKNTKAWFITELDKKEGDSILPFFMYLGAMGLLVSGLIFISNTWPPS